MCGIGKGGNIIALAAELYRSEDVAYLLKRIELPFPSLIPPIHSADGHPGTDEPGWRELRGTLPESREASAPGGPSARNSHHYEPLPKKRKKTSPADHSTGKVFSILID